MSEKYAKSIGLPQKSWNKSYFKLNGRNVLVKVLQNKK